MIQFIEQHPVLTVIMTIYALLLVIFGVCIIFDKENVIQEWKNDWKDEFKDWEDE